MSCEKIRNLLNDYVDDLLPEKFRQEVEAHLEGCEVCREEVNRLRALLASVATLPNTIEPARDLWSDIESRLAEPNLAKNRPANVLPLRRDGVLKPEHELIPTSTEFDLRRWLAPSARFAVAAVALMAICGGIWLYVQSRQAAWEVARLQGLPQIGDERVEKTGRLTVGEWLETDSSSQAMITVGMIGHVKIESNTRIRLLQARLTDHRLDLARGKMHATIWAPPRLFFVETPSAVAVDLGCEYTLEVDELGMGLLHVTSGYVALEQKGRESIVPAGALCEMRPGVGPGTPYSENASAALREALAKLDFENGGVEELDIVFREARFADTFTLWHLLVRVEPALRPRVYDRMTELIPPPEGVTREGVLRGDKKMLDKWAETFGLGYSWWKYWLPL